MDLVVAEVEPDLKDFGEESGASGDFPNRGYQFEERVNGHYCIRSEHESAGISIVSFNILRLRYLFGC